MEGKMIQIGNSMGVRLPSVLIKQYDLKEAIEIIPTPDGILIQPQKKKGAREGWAEKIKAVIDKHGPEPVDEAWLGYTTDWEETEWKW